MAAKGYLIDLSGLRHARYDSRGLEGISVLCTESTVAASNGNNYPRTDLRVVGRKLGRRLNPEQAQFCRETAAAATHRPGPQCPVAKAKS